MNSRAAFLLCGGRSRRLGRDKRLLDLSGRPLIESVVAQLAVLDLPIFLGLDLEDDAVASIEGVGRWADRAPSRGPLPNLLAALQRWGGELLLCPADRLLERPEALAELLRFADSRPSAHAVAFETAGRVEPFHALYRPALVAALADAWNAGHESLRDFLAALPEEHCARLAIDSLGIDLNSQPQVLPLRKLAKEIP
jgi:molybdopterin-guanine dinucleotide biosynthesis protein A